MQQHQIVSREQWIAARKAHLAHEKELSQARERLAEERRQLPWVKVDKAYVFDGPNGKVTLADLFKGRPQLVVQSLVEEAIAGLLSATGLDQKIRRRGTGECRQLRLGHLGAEGSHPGSPQRQRQPGGLCVGQNRESASSRR